MLSPHLESAILQVHVGLVAVVGFLSLTHFRGDKAPVRVQPAVSKNDYRDLDPENL